MPGVRIKRQKKDNIKSPKLGLCQKIIDYVFRPMHLGRLTITLLDGNKLVYGSGKNGVQAHIRILNNNFFKKCVLYGDVGFGESYVDGDWQTDDITKVVEWMLINVENHPTLMDDKKRKSPVNFLKLFNNLITFAKKNSIKGSRKNIHDHYDLGNDFFKLFLDSTLTYSAAYFKRPTQSLEEAQYQKYEELCQKINLKHTDHLLEIGSGWGGFAIYAARNFGCRVHTVTISQQQYKYAQKRIKEEGLSNKIKIEICDYRFIEGQYDKIVSIEMLEAVGHDYYEQYFAQCHKLLNKEGILALQVILSPDHRYDSFRKNIDWIQKHIFPGSLLPSMARIQQAVSQTSTLSLYDFDDMTRHYVQTLNLWAKSFNKRIEQVKSLGLDREFIRKWNYYLSYCEAAFKTRNITVAQIVFSRANNMQLMK